MLEILKARFQDNKNLHMELSWLDVEKRLLEHPVSMDVLRRMEESGGEPDTIGYDEKTGKLIFCDCAKESPSGRRSLCYDERALQGRAKNPPSGSAEWKAKEIGRQRRMESKRNRRFDHDGGTLSPTAKSRGI